MKDNTKKKSLALFISLCSLFIFAGSLVAYFSDKVTGEASITAGTLYIDGAYELYYNGTEEINKVTGNKLENFNPGDFVVVKARFTNEGSKSAWIRNSIGLSDELTELTTGEENKPVIFVYDGATTDFVTSNPLDLESNGFTSDANVINGTVEKENGAIDSYEVSYTIYFSSTAGNAAQNKSLKLNLQTEVLQYRNNTTSPDDAAWQTVEEFVAVP